MKKVRKVMVPTWYEIGALWIVVIVVIIIMYCYRKWSNHTRGQSLDDTDRLTFVISQWIPLDGLYREMFRGPLWPCSHILISRKVRRGTCTSHIQHPTILRSPRGRASHLSSLLYLHFFPPHFSAIPGIRLNPQDETKMWSCRSWRRVT